MVGEYIGWKVITSEIKIKTVLYTNSIQVSRGTKGRLSRMVILNELCSRNGREVVNKWRLRGWKGKMTIDL